MKFFIHLDPAERKNTLSYLGKMVFNLNLIEEQVKVEYSNKDDINKYWNEFKQYERHIQQNFIDREGS